tara:strand:- start:943 stop:1590 length:648 start_codon:yes stop_codon:yes gene_type:complete
LQTLKLDDTTLPAIYSPAGHASALLVLAHGAGAGFEHDHMSALSLALNNMGISTLRFNFPFMQEGRRRVDNADVCIATIARAVATATRLCPKVKLFVGGHSFGGRMSTHYAVEHPSTAAGIILFSFPLHPSKKPATKRAAHLSAINEPMLFLSGDRDTLAEAALLQSVTAPLANARLHWLETADHSYKILKRTRKSAEHVYAEAARVASAWIEEL